MSSVIQKLVTVSAIVLISFQAALVLAASTSAGWGQDIHKDKDKAEAIDTFNVNSDELKNPANDSDKHPLDFLSIGDNAIQLNDGSTNKTLFERDLGTWPYYLLSYDSGTDPEADFLISVAKICALISVIGLIIVVVKFLRLRRLRSQMSQ